MNKTHQELLALILKIEGRTLEDELGFGCESQYFQKTLVFLYQLHQVGCPLSCEECPSVFYVKGGGHTETLEKDELSSNNFEILGKPLTTDRILMALATNGWIRKKDLSCCQPKIGTPILAIDLSKPLHLQEEAMRKLIDLLKI